MSEMDPDEYQALVARLNTNGEATPDLDTFNRAWEYDSNFIWRIPEGHCHNALETALEEVARLREANDQLARIASSVAVTLEQGKRDLVAHGYDMGVSALAEKSSCGLLTTQAVLDANPYRSAKEAER